MKYQTITKKMVSTVALLTLTMMTSLYSQEHSNTPKIILDNCSKFIYKVEKKISSFFNSSDKTPYKVYFDSIDLDVADYARTIQTTTRHPHDKCATMAHDLAEYARKIMSAILGVIKKYMGKPATVEQAKGFEKDLKAVFNPEEVFKTMISKLETLKKQALAEGHNDLVAQVTTIIKMIELKRKEWNAKKELDLFIGLTTRMSC